MTRKQGKAKGIHKKRRKPSIRLGRGIAGDLRNLLLPVGEKKGTFIFVEE